jgi:hypothetical protein
MTVLWLEPSPKPQVANQTWGVHAALQAEVAG